MKIRSHSESHIVQLDDHSRWRIFPGDLDLTLSWKPETDIVVVAIDERRPGRWRLPWHGRTLRRRRLRQAEVVEWAATIDHGQLHDLHHEPAGDERRQQRRTAADGTARTTGAATMTSEDRKADGYWYPDHAIYNATKDQLKAMPQFEY
jgi:hypothetical protein